MKRSEMLQLVTTLFIIVIFAFVCAETAYAVSSSQANAKISLCPVYNKKVNLEKLTPEQYEVTQKAATEKPFKNKYWNNNQAGIYVDIVSGEPLYSSVDKYKSGSTGWPSFKKPISENAVITKSDRSFFFIERTEVLSACSGSHLGHVFNDGPAPIGKRYCMNSAAMNFVPVSEMQARGYGEYLYLFENESIQQA